MEIITRKTLAAKAYSRWAEAYYDKKKCVWGVYACGAADLVAADLIALGEDPNPDDVDKIVGNASWTSLRCDECYVENPPEAVVFGRGEDWDSDTFRVCAECLTKALNLTKEQL